MNGWLCFWFLLNLTFVVVGVGMFLKTGSYLNLAAAVTNVAAAAYIWSVR